MKDDLGTSTFYTAEGDEDALNFINKRAEDIRQEFLEFGLASNIQTRKHHHPESGFQDFIRDIQDTNDVLFKEFIADLSKSFNKDDDAIDLTNPARFYRMSTLLLMISQGLYERDEYMLGHFDHCEEDECAFADIRKGSIQTVQPCGRLAYSAMFHMNDCKACRTAHNEKVSERVKEANPSTNIDEVKKLLDLAERMYEQKGKGNSVEEN